MQKPSVIYALSEAESSTKFYEMFQNLNPTFLNISSLKKGPKVLSLPSVYLLTPFSDVMLCDIRIQAGNITACKRRTGSAEMTIYISSSYTIAVDLEKSCGSQRL